MTRRQSSRPRPAVTPAPGLRLRREVDQALLELRTVRPDDDEAIRLVNDGLHGALAYTAALGETCQVAAAVDAVREAERHLDGHEPSGACTALEKAQEFLTGRSTRRYWSSGTEALRTNSAAT
ncbi:hypothetical protein [Kibdelosporangium aridum]|uniref:Uncharacterized protein n=1 Tax=Kibdelosporangium aridum TaxID=2030 RepID=A0A1W2B2J5_KIBAR|nr:hypothetical protein [Kibdelosporangium aridum]SMC67010.1 hypothetical protein SAMN05661093_01372 [Kibdelosporangium aridum]